MINIIKGAEINVFGRVQRVFFRDSTVRKAKALKLTGWARNEKDGSVKILASGAEENIKKLYEWCKRGPLLAKVGRVDIKWINGKSEFTDFKLIR